MRSERWLDYHLAVDLAFEEQELGVRGEALRSVHWLVLDLEYLIADDERLGAVAPLDNLGVALDLIKVLTFIMLVAQSRFWQICELTFGASACSSSPTYASSLFFSCSSEELPGAFLFACLPESFA